MVLITIHSIPALIAFTETQGRMPLITSQRRMLQLQGEHGRTGYALYLGGLAQALTKTIPTEHWMLQCRATDFQQKEVSQPPRRSAGLTPTLEPVSGRETRTPEPAAPGAEQWPGPHPGPGL